MIREHNRIVPNGAMRIADKQSDAVAYSYLDIRDRPCVQIFFGKQSKPVAAFYFRTEGERARTIQDYFGRAQAAAKRKADDKAARAAYVPDYSIGDILRSSYGYDMTIVEFHQVVEIRGKQIGIRKIASRVVVPDGGGAGRVTAEKDKFIGELVLKRPSIHGVRISDVQLARKWDGTPQYYNTWD